MFAMFLKNWWLFLSFSDKIKRVIEAVCVMLDEQPKRVIDPATGKPVYDYWELAKKKVMANTVEFLNRHPSPSVHLMWAIFVLRRILTVFLSQLYEQIFVKSEYMFLYTICYVHIMYVLYIM